jgi:predicted dehydrogenase
MKIAVLGLGFMGSTHLKAWKKVPGAQLVAVASNIEKQLTGDLSDIQGNIGGPGGKLDFSAVKKYRDPLEAVRDPEVEAVDICLPTHQHAEAALAALRAGKHVLVEKPMALDGASADEMIAEAHRSGRVLMGAQVVRFIPSYRAAAEMVRCGKLGQVRSAIFRRRCAAPAWSAWLSDPAASGGGVPFFINCAARASISRSLGSGSNKNSSMGSALLGWNGSAIIGRTEDKSMWIAPSYSAPSPGATAA